MRRGNHSDELICWAHLIWMSENLNGDPTVRILFVATGNVRAVYEGSGAWSFYSRWIRDLIKSRDRRKRRACPRAGSSAKLLMRTRLMTIPSLRVPVRQLESYGFARVDGDEAEVEAMPQLRGESKSDSAAACS